MVKSVPKYHVTAAAHRTSDIRTPHLAMYVQYVSKMRGGESSPAQHVLARNSIFQHALKQLLLSGLFRLPDYDDWLRILRCGPGVRRGVGVLSLGVLWWWAGSGWSGFCTGW